MNFSILNLMVFTAFSAWLTFTFQLPTRTRFSFVFVSFLLVLTVTTILGLLSPAGDGRLVVEENKFYVVFVSFAKLVAFFSLIVFLAKAVLPMFGVYTLELWLPS